MYCSLDEAFQTGNVIPEFRQQRKKRRNGTSSNMGSMSGVGLIERFSTQTNEGHKPILPPPESHVIEPDRPTHKPMTTETYVGGGTAVDTSYSNILSATETGTGSSFFLHPHNDSHDSQTAYLLEPDWTKPFQNATAPPWIQERLARKEAEIPLTPTPEASSLFDGMPTLWQKIPPTAFAPSSPLQMEPERVEVSEDRLALMESKLDGKLERMFAKLEALEKGRSEGNHMEIILFILGGLFLLLMLDLLVKQGTRASVMLAAAGGGLLHKRYMS